MFFYWTSLVAQTVKNLPAMQETQLLGTYFTNIFLYEPSIVVVSFHVLIFGMNDNCNEQG